MDQVLDAMNGILGVDIETASTVDLSSCGAWSYSLHPSTIVYTIVFIYQSDAGNRYPATVYRLFDTTQPDLSWLRDYIAKGGSLLAHNAAFERAIWTNILTPKYGFPPVPLDQWEDTQAMARSLNLPPTLEGVAKALGCKVQKDMDGSRLMKAMARGETTASGAATYPLATPDNLTRLTEYCRRDVETMLDAYTKMPSLPLAEKVLWRVDQRINTRGVYLDADFAAKLNRLKTRRTQSLADEVFRITGGELANSTSTPGLKAWLHDAGIKLPKLRRKKTDGSYAMTETANRATVLDLLTTDLPPMVARVLQNRLEANKSTSLAKLARVDQMRAADGRLYDAMAFRAADTGRWSSYGLQLHNLPKVHLTEDEAALARQFVSQERLDGLELMFDQPLSILSQLLRSIIAATPGTDIIAGDYSAIEARMIAWLAGQNDVIELFRDGVDVYQYAAESVGSTSRDLGKVCTLALGYGMGVVKFMNTAASRGILLKPKDAARIHRAWRNANHFIVEFWANMEAAVRQALENQSLAVGVGSVYFTSKKDCLFMTLPSGRSIRYWRPHVVATTKEVKVVTEDGDIITKQFEVEEIRYYGPGKDKVRMELKTLYGGKIAQHATQASACDIMAGALVRLDRSKPYDVIMHVHDSIAAEVPKGTGDVDEFCAIMSKPVAWADGLPVRVEGYRDDRFRG